MTKQDNFQKELKEKVKEGIKPSHLRKSKSLSAIPVAPPLPKVPLKKSQSQSEIPLTQQLSPQQQITDLQAALTFTQNTAQNYLKNLQLAQVKISELEEELKNKETFTEAPEENPAELKVQILQLEQQILELRLDKIKEFGDYYQKKQDLETELELNINTGIKEINRLETKLLTTNKKKFELQNKLGQELSKNAQLASKLLDNQELNPSWCSNYKLIILIVGLYCLSAWLLSKNAREKELN